MAIRVDSGRCVGAGQCSVTAPHVFDLDDETGVVEVDSGALAAAEDVTLRRAAANCPSGAVEWVGP